MAWLQLEKFGVLRGVGLPELIAGVGAGCTQGETLEQLLPKLLLFCDVAKP